MERLPSISIITGTYNSDIATFLRVLQSLAAQDYPTRLVEHIIMDGGSTNGCTKLARKYGCKIIVHRDSPDEEQVRPALGILMAKHELILILESDNILTSPKWLRQMVEPFIRKKTIFCTYSAYNSYERKDSFITRYCALFGSPDPTLYYLRKTEKIRMDQKFYDKGEVILEKKNYYIVRFTENILPTLGDNGHMFLRKAIIKAIKNPADYTHTDAFSEMLVLGYDTFGVVKNEIIHIMNPHILDLVRRRIAVKQAFYDTRRGRRKYLVFNWKSTRDKINLIKYIVFSLTFVIPLFESVRGYLRIRDKAWFLHPFMCFLMVITYGQSEVQWFFRKSLEFLQERSKCTL